MCTHSLAFAANNQSKALLSKSILLMTIRLTVKLTVIFNVQYTSINMTQCFRDFYLTFELSLFLFFFSFFNSISLHYSVNWYFWMAAKEAWHRYFKLFRCHLSYFFCFYFFSSFLSSPLPFCFLQKNHFGESQQPIQY